MDKARLLAEKRLTKVETKLGEIKLKIAQAESLNLAHAKEVAELTAAFMRTSGTMKDSRMLRTLWSLLSTKLRSR